MRDVIALSPIPFNAKTYILHFDMFTICNSWMS